MRVSALTFVTALLAGTCLASAKPTQSNPAVAQLIMSLTPTGSLRSAMRGIIPITENTEATSGKVINSFAALGTISSTDRGIKPSSSGIEAPGSESAMQISPKYIEVPSANIMVDFQTGSANLTAQAIATLNQLGEALISPQLEVYNFKIAGHTDTVGDPSINELLSEERASAVKSFLETRFGISGHRLQAVGLGENELLVPTPPQTPEQLNRRVQIINIGQ